MCSLGIKPTTFCAADAMLYYLATQEYCTHRTQEHFCTFISESIVCIIIIKTILYKKTESKYKNIFKCQYCTAKYYIKNANYFQYYIKTYLA